MSPDNASEELSVSDIEFIAKNIILEEISDDIDAGASEFTPDRKSHVIAKFILAKLRLQIKDDLENAREEVEDIIQDTNIDKNSKHFQSLVEVENIWETSRHAIEYYTLTMSLIEHHTINILMQELIEEEYQSTNRTKELLEDRLNQEEREDFLLRTGIIDDSLKSEMTHVRLTRNRLVHDIHDRVFLESIEDLGTEIDRAADTLDRIFEISIQEEPVAVAVSSDSEED